MATTQKHIVKKGETLAGIAGIYMIVDWKREIWDAPFNKDLRNKTKNPNKIQPGWEVHIPKIKMPAGKIYAQVGAGKWSLNRPDDLKAIKELLNKHAKSAGFKELPLTPKADNTFLTALKTFQKAKGLRADGIIAPNGNTHKALGKTPDKPDNKKVCIVTLNGKQYAADEAEISQCLKKLSNFLSKKVASVEKRITTVRNAYNILENHPYATAAVWLAGNSGYYKIAGDNLAKAESAIKDAKSKVARADAKSMLAGQKQLDIAVKHINISGGALQKTVDDSGASVDAFLEVVVVADTVATLTLEAMLTGITRNPVLASTITAGYKQALNEGFDILLKSQKYEANGGFNGAVCRVIVKSAEGRISSHAGKIISKRAAPFATKMGRYIQKTGLIGKILSKHLPGLQKYVFKKYGSGLPIVYPKLVETDIALEIVEKAANTVWSAGPPMILTYFTNWYDTYHIDICNQIVSSREKPEAAASSTEKKAMTEKVCRPLVEKFLQDYQDEIAKEVVKLMKKKAKASA